jgi:hypothetical protein
LQIFFHGAFDHHAAHAHELALHRAFFGAELGRHFKIDQRLLHAAVDDVGEGGEYDDTAD